MIYKYEGKCKGCTCDTGTIADMLKMCKCASMVAMQLLQ